MQKISSNTFNPPHPLKTAVLFLVFNRPDTTKQVFEAICQAKPPRLYVAADGPRVDKPGEAEKVEQVRQIATQVDWDCEVKTLFRENNLGCKIAVSSAIDWFFENVEEGIILEDDCLPSQSFFWFCQELLEKYQDDERVMLITGFNAIGRVTNESYFFSTYGGIWGWASWSRAWKYFDADMRLWPKAKKLKILDNVLYNKKQARWREKLYEKQFKDNIDTWDYQWSFARISQRGLSIVSNMNMVKNIGFGPDATHNKEKNNFYSKLTFLNIAFPLEHPLFFVPSKQYDAKLYKLLNNSSFLKIICRILKVLIHPGKVKRHFLKKMMSQK